MILHEINFNFKHFEITIAEFLYFYEALQLA